MPVSFIRKRKAFPRNLRSLTEISLTRQQPGATQAARETGKVLARDIDTQNPTGMRKGGMTVGGEPQSLHVGVLGYQQVNNLDEDEFGEVDLS